MLEDVFITEACDECFFLFNWLDDLPCPEALHSPDNKEDFSMFENPIWDDSDHISICETDIPEDEDGEHLRKVCEWYEDIETYLSSSKSWFPTMRSQCTTTRNPTLITQIGILEVTIDTTLTQALEKVEYVIEVSTWIRQSTSDESKLKNTEPEELRIAIWEMRMRCVELESHEGCADAVTEKLGVMASEV
jgi:hypothetical protein